MALMEELCRDRGIDIFHIGPSHGNTEFHTYVEGIVEQTAVNPLDTILIVGDNDDGVEDSFERVREQLRRAQRKTGLSVPDRVFDLAARNERSTATVIMMIPFNEHQQPTRGCLETVLLPTLDPRFGEIVSCVDTFRICVDQADWSITRDDKMRLRSVLAAGCAKPNISVRWALKPGQNIFDLRHQSLSGIADFLSGFEGWVATQRANKF